MRYTQKPYAHVVEAFQEYLAKLGQLPTPDVIRQLAQHVTKDDKDRLIFNMEGREYVFMPTKGKPPIGLTDVPAGSVFIRGNWHYDLWHE